MNPNFQNSFSSMRLISLRWTALMVLQLLFTEGLMFRNSRMNQLVNRIPAISTESHLINRKSTLLYMSSSNNDIPDEYDVIVIGAGIGGLCSAAILSSVYKQRVGVYESHYHPGGCTHSFPMKRKDITFNFDSGPTILLGCSQPPFNPLQQVLNAVGASKEIQWVPYTSWGMETESGSWDFKLGEDVFETGPLLKYGGEEAVKEFRALRKACEPLITAAVDIPTMSLRGDQFKLLPLLSHIPALQKVIPYADVLNGSFQTLMEAHVTNPWLISWLNALAFSLSGLPAYQTGAAAMAYTLYDLHRGNATLDYPVGGIGRIAEVLVNVIQQSDTGSDIFLSKTVDSILVENNENNNNNNDNRKKKNDTINIRNKNNDNNKVCGILLTNGQVIKASKSVICNTDIWSLSKLLKSQDNKLTPVQKEFVYQETSHKKFTKSFLHLHLGLNVTGLDTSLFKPHYTVMDQGLHYHRNDSSVNNSMNSMTNNTSNSSSSSSGISVKSISSSSNNNSNSHNIFMSLNERRKASKSNIMNTTYIPYVTSATVDPCSDRNMVAVSNPSMLDPSLVRLGKSATRRVNEKSTYMGNLSVGELMSTTTAGGAVDRQFIVVHAYGAGNENYEDWEKFKSLSSSSSVSGQAGVGLTLDSSVLLEQDLLQIEYDQKKELESAFLYRSVSRALGMSIAEIKQRAMIDLVGTPLTHERFLSRYKGTYGASWGEMLAGPVTPLTGLLLCGDSVFPGIGVPAVALSGASAANTAMPVMTHLQILYYNQLKNGIDRLKVIINTTFNNVFSYLKSMFIKKFMTTIRPLRRFLTQKLGTLLRPFRRLFAKRLMTFLRPLRRFLSTKLMTILRPFRRFMMTKLNPILNPFKRILTRRMVTFMTPLKRLISSKVSTILKIPSVKVFAVDKVMLVFGPLKNKFDQKMTMILLFFKNMFDNKHSSIFIPLKVLFVISMLRFLFFKVVSEVVINRHAKGRYDKSK